MAVTMRRDDASTKTGTRWLEERMRYRVLLWSELRIRGEPGVASRMLCANRSSDSDGSDFLATVSASENVSYITRISSFMIGA